MKQNNFMLNLINANDQLQKLYTEKKKMITPIWKGILALIVLLMTSRMFDYGSGVNRIIIIVLLAAIQAALPLKSLYYFASAVILLNLWKVSTDIFVAFLIFLFVFMIVYFREGNHYSYLAVIVPVLFCWHLELLAPAVLATAIGMNALLPAICGVGIYYFAITLKDVYSLLSENDVSSLAGGIQYVLTQLIKNKTFFVMLAAVFLTIVIASFVYKIFYERAWMLGVGIGNATMAIAVLLGRMYFDLDISVALIIVEMFLGILFCLLVEFIRGIGDVGRTEQIVFEDDEYIYYVKAVPKFKPSKSEQKVKVMNEELLEEEMDEDVEDETTKMGEEIDED